MVLYTILIAILYNMFLRSLAGQIFVNPSKEMRYDQFIYFYIITGIFAIIIANILHDKNINKNISSGLKYGGYGLIFSTILFEWSLVSNSVKVLILGGLFIYVISMASQNSKLLF